MLIIAKNVMQKRNIMTNQITENLMSEWVRYNIMNGMSSICVNDERNKNLMCKHLVYKNGIK